MESPTELYYPRASAQDITIEEKSQIFQNKYRADSIYEWNVLMLYSQCVTRMTMVSNFYKIKLSLFDHAIV